MINWEEQWAQFAPNFYEGFAHITLKNNSTLKLKPGPGFGDLSHPTTRLCLRFLEDKITPESVVLEIGSGSGILSLAAALLGAKEVHGIDIDPQALAHSVVNKQVNKISNVSFSHIIPKKFKPSLVVMNMIYSEQVQAWIPSLKNTEIITSGVLDSQRTDYLKLASLWQFSLLEEREEASWLALLFKKQ